MALGLPMSVPIDAVPPVPRKALQLLSQELSSVIGEKLLALWAYGAMIFPEPPRRLGDVDTHAVVALPLDATECRAVKALHDSIAKATGVEWDSWYVAEADARGNRPPAHLLAPETIDNSWAFHRAHWLAGKYVALQGLLPSAIVESPNWPELEEAMLSEMLHIERLVAEGRHDADHAAYAVWNGCRIAYSMSTKDVAISKREAGRWALIHLDSRWHPAIRSAERVYDQDSKSEDAAILEEAMAPFVGWLSALFDGRRPGYLAG